MADSYEAKIVVITEASITPNPAVINQQIKISVKAEERTVILEAEKIYSGEFYSGEVK